MNENFEIGMELEAELSPDGTSLRYDYRAGHRIVDSGPSGNIIKAVVKSIDKLTNICLLYYGTPNKMWGIPLKGNQYYQENQWTLPGFPIPAHGNKRAAESIECTCGVWSTYSHGVGKGGGHSPWCDIERVDKQ